MPTEPMEIHDKLSPYDNDSGDRLPVRRLLLLLCAKSSTFQDHRYSIVLDDKEYVIDSYVEHTVTLVRSGSFKRNLKGSASDILKFKPKPHAKCFKVRRIENVAHSMIE